ncbi:MAG: hypothetical protein VYA60_08115 [Pseudomonadota bacterium]|nr:hypothetical protein [Pseudomonadota bacterium]
MDTVQESNVAEAEAVDVGGSSYETLYNPNLSEEANKSIANNVNKSFSGGWLSGDTTDVYCMENIREALNADRLQVTDHDVKVLNAITQSYIEIQNY